MSAAEVKNLRNQNRFEEAYKMSQQDFETSPSDIWLKRSHAWSLYYMIKKHVQAGEEEVANRYLAEFESLDIPQDDRLIHERMAYFKNALSEKYISSKKLVKEGRFWEAFDLCAAGEEVRSEQLAWTLYYLIRNHNKAKNQDHAVLLERLEIFARIVSPKKQLVYKLILQELIRLPIDYWTKATLTGYLEFLGLFDVLDQEDFEKQEYEGLKLMALAERLHIAYSKALIREQASHQKVATYLSGVVEQKLEKCKGMLYVPFFKAKLLLDIGDREQGMKAFIPFAKRKQGEFWVWQVFAEYYQKDSDLYLSCLCKALTCRAKPEFLSGIKERLITHLTAMGDYDWAKTELIGLLQIREKQGWAIRTSHRIQLESAWYLQAKEIALKTKYQNFSAAAELLIADRNPDSQPVEMSILVENINEEKHIFNFITAAKTTGYAKYKQKPELGQAYRLKGGQSKSGFYEIESLKRIDNDGEINHFRKKINAKVVMVKDKAFGFVDGAFLTPALVEKNGLKNGQLVSGLAIQGPVKGKTEWAWKVILIEKT